MIFSGQTALAQGTNFEEQRAIERAVELVTMFIGEHMRRYRLDMEPLLNDASAARLYLADSLAVDGLQGRLGFDPVYGGQDSLLTALRIFPDPEAPILQGAAQIRVEMVHFGTRARFIYTLIDVNGGDWQINDITSEFDGWSLGTLMQENNIPFAPAGPQDVTLYR